MAGVTSDWEAPVFLKRFPEMLFYPEYLESKLLNEALLLSHRDQCGALSPVHVEAASVGSSVERAQRYPTASFSTP